MYDTIRSFTQMVRTTSLTIDSSVINNEYSVKNEGVIALYVCKTQLSIFIETKEDINLYAINPDTNQMGQWHTNKLQRTSEHANEFALLRTTSEGYIELNEHPPNLELFREMLNQETLVGFSNIREINCTVQLALSVLNSIVDFEYNPAQPFS